MTAKRFSLPWFGCAVVAVSVFAIAYGGIELTRGTGRLAAIWGANAAVLVALLIARKDRFNCVLAAGFFGNMAANVLAGDTLLIDVCLPLINMTEVLICYAGLKRFGDHDLTRPRTLLVFAGLAVGPASVVSALLAASLFAALGKADFLTLLVSWYTADALGLITFTPLFASLAIGLPAGRPPLRGVLTAAAAAAAFATLIGLVFYQSAYPLLFVVFPALIFVAFRFGFLGSSIALVVTALVALIATANGHGPLSLVQGSLREKIFILQAFIAISAFTSLQVSAVLAERARLITQLRAAKTEAETANRALLLAEQVAQVGHWRIDLGTGVLSWSDEVFRMHGRDPSLGAPELADAIKAYHPDDRAEVESLFNAAIAEKGSFTFKLRLVTTDEEERTVFSRGLCETSAEGEVTAVFGTITDMTDLTRAEEAVRASESRFRLLAENASELFILGHDDGRRSYISPASIRLLGFTPDELGAMRLRDYVHPDDLAALYAATRRLGEGDLEASVVYRALHKVQGWITVEGTFRRVAGGRSGEPTIVATFRDVSEREAQAEVVEAARAAAEEALTVKSAFVAMMSHELRTPLNSIIGFSNLIAESGEVASPQGQRFVRNIQTSSGALLAIVNDVMDVSKIEAGAIELDPQPFNLRTLCEDMAGVVQWQADEKGLTLTVDVDARIPERLIADDSRLGQIILNLLSNAVKFTAKGEVALTASLEWRDASEASVRIIVSDTGIGIPDDKRDRLFKPFSQVDRATSRRFGGTGLGLSICKSLLDMMGGAIEVESRENAGSTFAFTLRLPLAGAAADAPTSPVAPEAQGAAPLRILVAEDAPMNQELLAAMLAKWGHVAEIVGDGVEAVEAARFGAYDLVLMDIQMPVMDGVEATRRIRASQTPSANVPIVALTANVLPEDVARFHQAGMDGHVAKPFVPEELRAAIVRLSVVPSPESAMPEHETRPGEADLEDGKLEELNRLVGPVAVQSFLARLGEQMDTSFVAAPKEAADIAAVRYEAHALASTAGMLGFRALSDASVALESACRSQHATPGSVIPALAGVLAARGRARTIVDGLLAEAGRPDDDAQGAHARPHAADRA